MASYQLRVDASKIRALAKRLGGVPDPASPEGRRFGLAMRNVGEIVRQQAVWNVGKHPVTFNGRTFVIQPRTGTLRGSIESEWPYGSPYRARVYVNGAHTAISQYPGQKSKPRPVSEYAAAVEFGHGEIDLKKTMRGKIVPFFAARSKSATGPYAATGLERVAPKLWTSRTLNNRLAAKGKNPMYFHAKGKPTTKGGTGTYYIAFRRVGATGWVIPKKEGRPFMGATMTQTRAKVTAEINAAVADVLAQP